MTTAGAQQGAGKLGPFSAYHHSHYTKKALSSLETSDATFRPHGKCAPDLHQPLAAERFVGFASRSL
jgi:hypothetical protein